MARKTSIPAPWAIRLARAAKTVEHWLTARLVMAFFWLLRRLPPDRALDFVDRAARRIGPWVGRHRTALDNLRKAYPDKPQSELEEIALDMWGNMARLAGEYVYLDQLFDYDPEQPDGTRIEVEGKDLFLKLRDEKRPHIFFTGHIGNFEMLPMAAARFDLPLTVLFRAPNNPYIADYIFSRRSGLMGDMVASRAGAAFSLARILESGGNIGALTDQKYRNGIPTTFFGRDCLSSPLVARLARQYDCDIYPAYVTRLPGNRFRVTLQGKLEIPRTTGGDVDINALTQQLNDVVEDWVCENPGQWMWFHKRWKLD